MDSDRGLKLTSPKNKALEVQQCLPVQKHARGALASSPFAQRKNCHERVLPTHILVAEGFTDVGELGWWVKGAPQLSASLAQMGGGL